MKHTGSLATQQLLERYNHIHPRRGKEQLHMFKLEDRPFPSNFLIENLLDKIIEPTSQDEIKSIVLFGSAVQKSPYYKREGRTFFRNTKLQIYMGDQKKLRPMTSLDFCIITESYESKNNKTLFLDDGVFDYSDGLVTNLYWVPYEKFKEHLVCEDPGARRMIAFGVPLADDGFFKSVSPNAKPKYTLNWESENKYHNDIAGVTGEELKKENALSGSLVYAKKVPVIPRKR